MRLRDLSSPLEEFASPRHGYSRPGPGTVVPMTTPTADHPIDSQPDEFHGPAEVRAALISHATTQTLAIYDRELDTATRESKDTGDVAPLLRMLEHWWTAAQLAAGVVPTNFRPVSPDEAVASWEAKHGRPLYGAA